MKDKDILAAGLERMKLGQDADRENRELAADDMRFVIGQQWEDADRAEREAAGKPCITINGMAQFVRQVTGQIRDMNPAIRVMASDNAATKDVAEIYEGLIRHIEYRSDADTVYESAAESAAGCGIGHWRVKTQYAQGLTFDQEVLIERIHNPFAVIWDPCAKDPTRKDAQWCFILDEMARDTFKKEYPKASAEPPSSDHKPAGLEHWYNGDTITVAEYFWIEYETVKIGLTDSGQIVRNPKPPENFVAAREVDEPRVKWAKMTGSEILEGPQSFPGRFIPVVAVVGEEWHVGEGVYRSSVVRFAKDPQRLYNFARSMAAEIMTLQPKAPYMVTVHQISGLEDLWSQANTANRPYLVYNPDPEAPAPQRVPPPVASAAVMTEVQVAGEDMKRTTGIYDASLGAKSNETSGKAINARQQETQNGTSIYADNMIKAVTHTGRILVSIIPEVYDTQRVISILGEDDQEKLVMINHVMMSEQGAVVANDMASGRYEVRISVGPSYQTKRQEASEGMFAFMQALPGTAPMFADLVAGMQEWPEADRVAERLRKTLPPQLQEQDDKQPQDPAQMQAAQMQAQAQQQAQQIAQRAEMAKLAQEEAKAAKAQAEAQKAAFEAREAEVRLAQMMGQGQPVAYPAQPGFPA